MDTFPELNVLESVAIAQNASPILIRSRRACGLPGSGFVAALTDKFNLTRPLSDMQVVAHTFGAVLDANELKDFNVFSVTREEWEQFKATIHRDADANRAKGFETFRFPANLSYDDMLINGFKCYADNHTSFEILSFPAKFMLGTGHYTEKRKHQSLGSFREYYTFGSRQYNHSSTAHLTWIVWSKLIDVATGVCAQKALAGVIDERRHLPFLGGNVCAVCGPVGAGSSAGAGADCDAEKMKKCSRCKLIWYCSKEHQVQDWPVHKRFCKTCTNPGCSI
jgi:hypothetical protein